MLGSIFLLSRRVSFHVTLSSQKTKLRWNDSVMWNNTLRDSKKMDPYSKTIKPCLCETLRDSYSHWLSNGTIWLWSKLNNESLWALAARTIFYLPSWLFDITIIRTKGACWLDFSDVSIGSVISLAPSESQNRRVFGRGWVQLHQFTVLVFIPSVSGLETSLQVLEKKDN